MELDEINCKGREVVKAEAILCVSCAPREHYRNPSWRRTCDNLTYLRKSRRAECLKFVEIHTEVLKL
jgi:hypothetical protein